MAFRGSAPLWIRLGLPIAAIISLAIGFINFLNYFNYQKTYRQLNLARVMVIGRDLVQAVEAGLNFGLAPKNNTQLDAAVSLAKDSTAGLNFVALTDESGAWVGGSGNAPTAHDWSARLAAAGKDAYWRGGDAESYQVGLPYRNSFGVIVGAVVLGYDKSAIEAATASMRAKLLFDWLMASAVFGSLALLGVWRLTRRIEGELAQVTATLSSGPAPDLRLPLLGPEIQAGIPDLLRQSAAAGRALDAATAESTR